MPGRFRLISVNRYLSSGAGSTFIPAPAGCTTLTMMKTNNQRDGADNFKVKAVRLLAVRSTAFCAPCPQCPLRRGTKMTGAMIILIGLASRPLSSFICSPISVKWPGEYQWLSLLSDPESKGF